MSEQEQSAPLGFLRPALEGGTDLLLGLLGLSATERETPANTVGQLLQAAAPVAAPLKAIKRVRGFHGSPHDFDRFDIAKAGTTTDPGELGRALYFGTDPKVVGASPHKYEVDLSINSPLEVAMTGWGHSKAKIVRKALGLPDGAGPNDITAAARGRGHDSVALDYSPLGYKHKEYAVFDDSAISILRKFGLLAPLAGGAAAAGSKDALLQALSGRPQQ